MVRKKIITFYMFFEPIKQYSIYSFRIKFLVLKVVTYFIFASALLIFSCKSDKVDRPAPILNNQAKQAGNLTNPAAQISKETNGFNRSASPNEIATQRAQALAIINHRLKSDSQSYAIVEADTWEYEFVFNKEMSKPGEYAGVWLDFKPNHTYEYGKNGTIKGSGKYNYSLEREQVVMVDNDSSKKPQEWEVKHAGDMMVMVGTATYKDNHMQQKLVRKPDSIRK